MDDYLAKPLRPEILAETLERWVQTTQTLTGHGTCHCRPAASSGPRGREPPVPIVAARAQPGYDGIRAERR